MGDKVNHPDHYQLFNGMETIDFIEAVTGDIETFDVGNALKYICRYKKKNGIEDLKKAVWYLQHLIDHKQKDIRKQIDELNNKMNGGVQ